jgi:hypothetical protein
MLHRCPQGSSNYITEWLTYTLGGGRDFAEVVFNSSADCLCTKACHAAAHAPFFPGGLRLAHGREGGGVKVVVVVVHVASAAAKSAIFSSSAAMLARLQGYYLNARGNCQSCPESKRIKQFASCCFCDPKEIRPMARYPPEENFQPCKACLRGAWPVPVPGATHHSRRIRSSAWGRPH